MKCYIEANRNVGEVDLPDELLDNFYGRVQEKFKHNDHFTVSQGEAKILVVVVRDENKQLDAIINFNIDVEFPWREDPEWGKWDTEVDLWDKIKELDGFFEKKYRYVKTIKIYPESVIPAGSYDFFERMGRSNSQIGDIVKIARTVE
jgi:hypothetical protein